MLLAAVLLAAASASANATRWKQDEFAISFFAQDGAPPIDDVSFALMAAANFTAVGLFDHLKKMPDKAACAEQQRMCAKYDLKCLLNGAAYRAKDGSMAGAPQRSASNWGFYLRDEPNAHEYPALAKQVAAVRAASPGSMSFVNLLGANISGEGHGNNASGHAWEWGAPTYQAYLKEFVEVVKPDVLAFDHYPSFGRDVQDDRHGDTREDYVRNLELVSAVANQAAIPLWQYFNIVGRKGKPSGPASDPKRNAAWEDPTEAQVRWQISTSLAYGVKGLLYFQWHPFENEKDGLHLPGLVLSTSGPQRFTPAPQYFVAQRLNAWVMALAPTLLHAVQTGTVSLRWARDQNPAAVLALGGGNRTLLKNISRGDWTLGCFETADGKLATMIVNHEHAFIDWVTIEWSAGKAPGKVLEVSGHSGKLVAVADEAPDTPGLQLRFLPGQGRLFVAASKRGRISLKTTDESVVRSACAAAAAGGVGAWPEVGEHDKAKKPPFGRTSTGFSHGNVRARVCVAADADVALVVIPWLQRALIAACPPPPPKPPPPMPPPTPADPCHWHRTLGGFNNSHILGPKGNIKCGNNLESLKADCCKDAGCASVSWIETTKDGCLKPDDDGPFTKNPHGSGYIKLPKAPEVEENETQEEAAQEAPPLCIPQVIVRSAVSGLAVRNVLVLNATREAGAVAFEAEFGPGEYHVYYLPHTSVVSGGFWTVETKYLPLTASGVEAAWRARARAAAASGAAETAAFIELQPRVEFHRFTETELVASAAEAAAMLAAAEAKVPKLEYLLFPDDRANALRLTNSSDLCLRWARRGPSRSFSASARRGEWLAFQVGVFAVARDLVIERATFGGGLSAMQTTCLNLGGVDELGRPFVKWVYLAKGHKNALWFGVQVPLDAAPGTALSGSLSIDFGGSTPPPAGKVEVSIKVSSAPALTDHGDADTWRLSRLRWLDSTIGSDDTDVPPPFVPVALHKASTADGGDVSALDMRLLGRRVLVGGSGLPSALSASADLSETPANVLATGRTVTLTLGGKEVKWSSAGPAVSNRSNSQVAWLASGSAASGAIKVSTAGSAWFDGYGEYSIELTAGEDGAQLGGDGVVLTLPLSANNTKMLMGMGRRAGLIGKTAGELPLHWDWSHTGYQVWIGSPAAGIRFKFSGPEAGWGAPSFDWHSTPPAWVNNGSGGANITRDADGSVLFMAYTGALKLNPRETVKLYFELILTPLKPFNHGVKHPHWKQRYYQVGYGKNGSEFKTPSQVAETGATVVNLHQGISQGPDPWPGHTGEEQGLINPYIDWPFEAQSVRLMSDYVEEGRKLGLRTKFYYTVRELSNHAAELWALRSLGKEILAVGQDTPANGGTSWLREHLVTDYAKCWQNPLSNGEFDSAVCDTGVSRWTNFYIEGLNISTASSPRVSGVYYDGILFPRTTMLRIRRVLAANVGESALIDLHQSNGSVYAQPALTYLMFFPYVDSLWFGESFRYDSPADEFLIAISGLGFGLTGDMLGDEAHGAASIASQTTNHPNVFKGMLYGMTTRYGCTNISTSVWRLWDSFGIDEARMLGWWEPSAPVSTNHRLVEATAYVRKGNSTLLVLASWLHSNVSVELTVDWAALGLEQSSAAIEAPPMDGVQPHKTFAVGAPIAVEASGGWMLLITQR